MGCGGSVAAPVVSVVAAGGSEGCVEGAAAVMEVMNEGDGGGEVVTLM